MAVSTESALAALKKVTDPNTGKDYVSTRSARNLKVEGADVSLLQLFQNLVGNAIRYRKPHERPRIEVWAEANGKDWLFAVKDNGIGIAPEYHKQVFGVFKRLNRGTASGTGIGLAICQRVVERYGGSIWVESEEGHGATFRFTLPLEK